jgi:hypothetical protein
VSGRGARGPLLDCRGSPGLARLAAACLATLMGGVVATHVARREPAAPAVVMAVFAIVVAAFR